MEIFSCLANQPISMAVKAFRCAFGKRSLRASMTRKPPSTRAFSRLAFV